MLRKTHLAIGVAATVYLLPHINDRFIFMFTAMMATLLPDIDKGIGFLRLDFWKKSKAETPNHRGFLHSYTFCILISVLLAFFYPVLSLPFFIGYSMHLFADSFTVIGIRPFWPFNFVSKGGITTGSKMEDVVFWVFVLFDIFLVAFLYARFWQ